MWIRKLQQLEHRQPFLNMAKRAACETTRSKALRVVYEHLDLGNRLSEYKELHRRLQHYDVVLNARDVSAAIEMYRLQTPLGSLALAASRLRKPRTEFDYLRCLQNVLRCDDKTCERPWLARLRAFCEVRPGRRASSRAATRRR